MRTISTALDKILTAAAGYAVHTRVRVDKDGAGSYQDLSSLEGWDWVRGATLQEDVDAPMAKATVLLQREIEKLSLAKLVSGSKLNIGSTMVDIARSIKVDTATLPKGRRPAAADWVNHFDGYITHLDWGGRSPVLKLECLDLGWRLQRCFIETVQQYGSGAGTPVETVMQSIIDDNLGGGVVTLYTPVSPGWNVGKFKQQKEPVLVALRKLAAQIGWDVKYRWDNGTGAFRLTFFSVERDSPVVDRTFTAAQYRDLQRASLAAEDIRNKIKITFTHATNGRTTWTEEDAASQTKFGIHYMEIVEAAASLIDSDAEAEAMALAILKDLKDPTLDHAVAQPFFGPAMLGDYYTYAANGTHYDTAQSLAVVGISHELAPKTVRTVITTRGKPSLGKRRWLEMEGRQGVGPATDDGNDEAPTITATEILGGLLIKFDDPRTLEPPVRDWAYSEVYVSTSTIATPTLGDRPSSLLLAAKGRETAFSIGGLIPGQQYYTRVCHIDESGNVSAVSNEAVKATAMVGPYHLNPDSVSAMIYPYNYDFGIFTRDRDTNPPDYWTPKAPGSWAGAWTYDTGNQYSGKYALKFDAPAAPGVGSTTFDFESDFFPVEESVLWLVYVRLKYATNGATTRAGIALATYSSPDDADFVEFSIIEESALNSLGANNVWHNMQEFGVTSNIAKYAKVFVYVEQSAGDTVSDIYFDMAMAMRAHPSFRAYRATSNQSIPDNAWTKVQLNTETYDNGGNFDNAVNYRFVVPHGEDGVYQFEGATTFDAIASGDRCGCAIYKNGNRIARGLLVRNNRASADDVSVSVTSGRVKLVEGDVVEFYAWQDSAAGAARDILLDDEVTYFSGARVG